MTEATFSPPCLIFGGDACPVYVSKVQQEISGMQDQDPEAGMFGRELKRTALERVFTACDTLAATLPADTNAYFCPLVGEVVTVTEGTE